MTRYQLGRIHLVSLLPEELFQVDGGDLRHVVTVNAEIFVLAHEDRAYRAILERSTNTIDGQPIRWLAFLMNSAPWPRKLSGSDLIYSLAKYCRDQQRRLFLLGGRAEVTALARERLQSRFEGLQIAVFAPSITDNMADPAWNREILAELERYRPEYLIVILGSPKGELWIDRTRDELSRLGVRFVAGFGGAADFVAGLMPRAPKWMQYAGLEWLFRLFCEPRRRFRRTLRMFRTPLYVLKHQVLRLP